MNIASIDSRKYQGAKRFISVKNNMQPIFGSTKYREVARLTKRLKKALTVCDEIRIQGQIDFLHGEIKKEEKEREEFFERM